MERRFFPAVECPVSIENRDDETPKIVGRAAVFYDPEDAGTEFELFEGLVERINPRAFNKALRERHDVRALFNHDPNHVLGRTSAGTLKLAKSLRGLDYQIIPGKTTIATDVLEHIRRGDVTGSSFGFLVLDQKFIHDEDRDVDIREILSVELFDVSPVTFPAYGSTTSAVRAEADLEEVRSAYVEWKEVVTEQIDTQTRTAESLAAIKARVAELEE